MGALRPWIETAFLTALLPVLGYVRDPDDPLFVHSFPWVLVAPLILGLQNGFRYALTSGAALLAGALALWYGQHASTAGFPVSYALSVGLLGALAGEYRDSWQRALATARQDSDTRGRRLQQFTRTYHLLKRSHDELEQRIAGSGPSLQSALDKVQAQLERMDDRDLTEAGESILGLFAAHGVVQVASLHQVLGQGKDGIDLACAPEPAATLGAIPEIDLAHPMILDSLETKELTSVREERAGARGPMPLVCIPLTDSGGQVLGLVLVHELPFVLMHDEHMTLLATMGGRLGDWLAGGGSIVAETAHTADTSPAAPLDAPADTPGHEPGGAAARDDCAGQEPGRVLDSVPAN